MLRSVIVLAGFAVVWIAAEIGLSAQSATASLTVSATVSKNCTITTTPVAFGAYDAVTGNATAPLTGTGILTVTCTKGAGAIVGLGLGSNAQGTTRRMSASATAYLTYDLYKDGARTDHWGNALPDSYDIGAAPNRMPRSFTIFGQIPGGQDATVGNYLDTVVATVNF
jgi:spore coat protein U domain-containing protein, fimbrial subunit CupE1/2/3/6